MIKKIDMKINNDVFNNFFEHYREIFHSASFNGCDLKFDNKSQVDVWVNMLYKLEGKTTPHITWNSLDEIKEEFKDEEIEIITSISNINWVYFFNTFMSYIYDSHGNNCTYKIYYDLVAKTTLLEAIMDSIFGFIELEGEIILIEKPTNVYSVNNKAELNNCTGPVIGIGDFKRYYLSGELVTPKEWSKALRMAIMNPNDKLIKDINLDSLNKIRNEINYIDGDNAFYTNDPKIFIMYVRRDIPSEIVGEMRNSLSKLFNDAHMNAISFILPTDETERIECINPQIVPPNEYYDIFDTLKYISEKLDLDGL